jgi:hypothetical protein
MPTSPKGNLKYNPATGKWTKNGKAVVHPRYCVRPATLMGKAFIKSYLRSVQSGETLNDWLKTNQKFSKSEVQKAAKEFRAMFEAANEGQTFPLLKFVKPSEQSAGAKKTKALMDSLKELQASGALIVTKKKG